MIEPALIEEVWRSARWRHTTRGMRRFHIALSAGMGVFFWMFLPLLLLGAAFNDEYRSDALGTGLPLFAAGLASFAVAIFLHRLWAPADRAEAALKANGARVTGQLLKWRYVQTMGKIPLNSYYLFGAEGPDGTPVFARVTGRNGIPLGAAATIAYDPARPGAGVVVESVSELRRRARS